jgi:hypothetical protein
MDAYKRETVLKSLRIGWSMTVWDSPDPSDGHARFEDDGTRACGFRVLRLKNDENEEASYLTTFLYEEKTSDKGPLNVDMVLHLFETELWDYTAITISIVGCEKLPRIYYTKAQVGDNTITLYRTEDCWSTEEDQAKIFIADDPSPLDGATIRETVTKL